MMIEFMIDNELIVAFDIPLDQILLLYHYHLNSIMIFHQVPPLSKYKPSVQNHDDPVIKDILLPVP